MKFNKVITEAQIKPLNEADIQELYNSLKAKTPEDAIKYLQRYNVNTVNKRATEYAKQPQIDGGLALKGKSVSADDAYNMFLKAFKGKPHQAILNDLKAALQVLDKAGPHPRDEKGNFEFD
jgi:hypothetical protein